MLIASNIELLNKLEVFDEEVIKNEPMFFSSSVKYAYDNGGKCTKDFIDKLPFEWKNENTILDSRVHMLMKGWYPCIPGFHHDDVPRDRVDGQPEYYNPSYRSEHILGLYNGNICPTEFAIGTSEFSNPEIHKVVYKEWHKEVIVKLNLKELSLISAPANQLIYFDDRTRHQGNKALGNGWRLFIRVSTNTNRKVLNEIRRQVQVYLENPVEGW